MTWLRVKPSRLTPTGSMTLGSSLILKAAMVRSMTSWPFSQKYWIQPQSRTDMMSEWSFQMEMGADRARLAMAMTMAIRIPEAIHIISLIRASPWEEVAVKVRAPAAAEPTQALMALCSLSTGMNSASRWPSATSSERCSTMWVWGVMG